ncbi:Putative gamma-glutamylcyclotransferase CG2811 [Gryllus bimaculatus]|nr:Putative gamma-glutamylcyclotransferase CG2811 [Gryllus bimaculatus]
MDNIFVYGTLKRNEPNHNWLEDEDFGYSQYICNARTVEKYPLVIATRYNLPFLLDVPGEGHHVSGEVYEIDYPMLQHLDVLQQYPDFYYRDMIEVLCGSKKVSAFVYVLREFRPFLMEEPFLEEYSSNGDHGKRYVERAERDHTYDFTKEVQF